MAVEIKAQSVVNRFAFKEYGQVIHVDPPIYNEKGKFYTSNVRANYPVYIFDDRVPNDYEIRVLKIEHLGQIMLNNKLQIIPTHTTYGDRCRENLTTVLNAWKRQAENIIVSSSSYQLIQIEAFKNHFSQIEEILEYMMEQKKIHRIELTKYVYSDRKQKRLRYVNLLESLNILRYEEPYYVMGNTYITIELEAEDDKELLNGLLSHIIKYRYQTLKDEFRLTILEKTVGVDSVIYIPELQIEKSVYRTKSSITKGYKKYYGKHINPLKLNQILRRLEKVGAIRRKSNAFYGDEKLREDMIVKKKKLEPLTISPNIPNIINY